MIKSGVMHGALAMVVEKAIAERTFPGCVIGSISTTGEHEIIAFGRLTYEAAAPEVQRDTIYDLASVTKSIPTASLAAMMLAQGTLRLDDRVIRYIPELRNDQGATIEDLLRYRVRGPRMSTLDFPTFEQIRTHIFENGFDGPPGESDYSNLPAFFLGIILERVAGRRLPALGHEYFFGPLDMTDTTFFPHAIERIAPTEIVSGKEIRGIVHDESARVSALRRRATGHAGIFSTAVDLLKFTQALFDGKFPPVFEAAKQGLGWQFAPEGLFYKTGFTGTWVAVDPYKNRALVLLSNRTYPTRPADAEAIRAVRRSLTDIVFSS